MIKYFISFSIFATLGFANVVGAISMVVESEPITLYEIESFSKKNNLSTKKAVDILVQKKIEDIEIKKMGIVISPYDIDKKFQEVAKQNNLTLDQFKDALKKEGHSEDALKKEIESALKREELYKRIVSSKFEKPDEDELKRYYERHKDRFNIPTEVELIEYISLSKEALELQKRQPMVNMPNVSVSPKSVDLKSINPQLAQLFVNTPDGSFTPVLNLGTQHGMFFIKSKNRPEHVTFEMAKPNIFAMLAKDKEEAVLIEYFEKKKSEANIKVLREPK